MKNIHIILLVLCYIITYKPIYNIKLSGTQLKIDKLDDNAHIGKDKNKDTHQHSENKDDKHVEEPEKPQSKNNQEDTTNNEEKIDQKDLENFVSSKNNKLQKIQDEALKELIVNEETLEGAKNVCEYVVLRDRHFKDFCGDTSLFEELEKLKKRNFNLYKQAVDISYDNDDEDFRILNKDGDTQLYIETDRHHPKLAILFLYTKLCIGGIPLACTNILKYENVLDMENKMSESENQDNTEDDMLFQDSDSVDKEESVADLTEDSELAALEET